MTGAMGLVGVLPLGRPGDPDSDLNWFATDWMDTARAQELLSFQHHSLPDIFAETRESSRLVAMAAQGGRTVRARIPSVEIAYRHRARHLRRPVGSHQPKMG